jgi:hypothetical protein
LLVDVDGVISLFGFDHADPPAAFPVSLDGTPHWLSSGAGARLVRLGRTFECVWCTGWEERAEEHLPRLLGLPGGWRHLVLGEGWKRAAIDAQGPARTGPTLLVSTDPAVGLTDAHVALLEAWARGFAP